MRHSWNWFLAIALLLGGCSSPGGDDDDEGGEGEGEGECSDTDHDGFGVGDGCLGDDCDEGNPNRQEGCAADCAAMPDDVGCECDAGQQPIPCFGDSEELAGVGLCRAGIKRCDGGVWTHCEGQVLPGEEACDTLDNNCDGIVDEGVTNECGTCGHDTCTVEEIGGEAGWDAELEGNGVVVDDGSLTLSEYSQLVPYLWAASQSDSSITLINTDTREQLARYLVTPNQGSEQPMSVSVLPWAGAVVAVGDHVGEWSRGHRITRIAYGPCPDTDGDGVVRTSTGYDDMYEFGDDDCVLWTKEYDFDFRVVTWETREQLDGRGDFIWAGGTGDGDFGGNQDNTIYELDSDGNLTGREVALPIPPSGMVIDPDGDLWVAAEWSQTGLARIDTDTLDFEVFATPQGEKLCSLASDTDGNIYMPNDLGSQIWIKETEEVVFIPTCWGTVAATDRAFWGGWCQHSVTRTELMDDYTVGEQVEFPLPGVSEFPYPSVSVTEEVFVLDPGSNNVFKMNPDTGELDSIADNIQDPGTCGDPTGVTNHRSVGAAGTYEHIFTGCPEGRGPTTFSHIVYDAETPPGTHVQFAVRVADDLAGLASAPSVSVGAAPDDASPLSLAPQFNGRSPEGGVLSLRVTLSPTETDVPRLNSVGLGFSCAPVFE